MTDAPGEAGAALDSPSPAQPEKTEAPKPAPVDLRALIRKFAEEPSAEIRGETPSPSPDLVRAGRRFSITRSVPVFRVEGRKDRAAVSLGADGSATALRKSSDSATAAGVCVLEVSTAPKALESSTLVIRVTSPKAKDGSSQPDTLKVADGNLVTLTDLEDTADGRVALHLHATGGEKIDVTCNTHGILAANLTVPDFKNLMGAYLEALAPSVVFTNRPGATSEPRLLRKDMRLKLAHALNFASAFEPQRKLQRLTAFIGAGGETRFSGKLGSATQSCRAEIKRAASVPGETTLPAGTEFTIASLRPAILNRVFAQQILLKSATGEVIDLVCSTGKTPGNAPAWNDLESILGYHFSLSPAPKVGPLPPLPAPQELSCPKKSPAAGTGFKELRAVWLSNVNSEILDSREELQQGLDSLKRRKFNTIYPIVWNRGVAHFRKGTGRTRLTEAFGESPYQMDRLYGRDVLQEVIEEARPRGLKVVPWFEYGFKIHEPSKLTPAQRKLLTRTDGRAFADDPAFRFAFLNPFHPEGQKLVTDLIVDAAAHYDIDGIQLDDHFSLPIEFGYDDYTVALYKSEHGGKSPPRVPNDPQWVKWRADKFTAYFRTLVTKVRAARPGIRIVLATNSWYWSYTRHLQDWRTWRREGLIDELIVQTYNKTMSTFQAEIRKPEVIEASKCIPVSFAFLPQDKMGRPSNASAIKNQIAHARGKGFDGAAFFHFSTLKEEHSKGIFAGQAPAP